MTTCQFGEQYLTLGSGHFLSREQKQRGFHLCYMHPDAHLPSIPHSSHSHQPSKKTTRRSVWLKSDPETESQVRKRVKQIYKFQSKLFYLRNKQNHPHQKRGTLSQEFSLFLQINKRCWISTTNPFCLILILFTNSYPTEFL